MARVASDHFNLSELMQESIPDWNFLGYFRKYFLGYFRKSYMILNYTRMSLYAVCMDFGLETHLICKEISKGIVM